LRNSQRLLGNHATICTVSGIIRHGGDFEEQRQNRDKSSREMPFIFLAWLTSDSINVFWKLDRRTAKTDRRESTKSSGETSCHFETTAAAEGALHENVSNLQRRFGKICLQ